MRKIKVISANKDGADLRQEQRQNKYYSRCGGTKDNNQINEAIESSGKGERFYISATAWERIFRGKN